MTTPSYNRVLDESAAMFFSNGGNGNPPPKRRREALDFTMNGINMFQVPQYEMINLEQLQTLHPSPSSVSTGLQLAFEDPIMNQWISPVLPFSPLDDFSSQINQYMDETDGLIRAQWEQLRRALVDKQQKYCMSILIAVEKSAAKTMRQKETQLEQTNRLISELENRLARAKAESTAWQAKAMAEQSKAFVLHAQLQQANATSAQEIMSCYDETVHAEDAQSAHIDPRRSSEEDDDAKWICRVCRRRTLSVLLLPCNHLCFCEECGAQRSVPNCPICCRPIEGCLQVLLS